MSHLIFILGESGTGKSTSMRNLDPSETFIINVIGKPLPFKGKKYSSDKKNYYKADNSSKIISVLNSIDSSAPHIKTVIIDDFQYIMANEFMSRAGERGYDKFTEIGQHAFSILEKCLSLRDDIEVFVLSHSEQGDSGKMKFKTIGRMLDDKISLEGLSTCVMHSVFLDGKYKFLTQFDGAHIAKSPMGMFKDLYIDNDLLEVKNSIINYYGEDSDAV